MTPSDLVQATSGPIGSIGASFYFTPETLGAGKALGLNGMQWYFVGRGGVLGDVEAPVVQSAFGYFAPAVVAKMWNGAKEKIAPRDAARRYHECAADHGRAKLGGVEGLGAFNEAAEAVVAAAEPAGLALFAGLAAEPRADDAAARAFQLVAVLRELRGSQHLVAVLAQGLTAEKAHLIKRPNDYKTFGYDEASAPEVTDADRAAMTAAEALTDRLALPAFSVLDDTGAAAFAAGVKAIGAALA
jgi:hypothetical protein